MRSSVTKVSRIAILRRFVATAAFRELVLFLVIGGTGAVLYTTLNVLFTTHGIHPSLSIAITLAVLIPPVYFLQHRLTFRSGRKHLSAFPRYVGAQLFGNVIAMIAAGTFAESIRLYKWPAWFLISAIVAALNYGILKFWAFRHHPVSAG